MAEAVALAASIAGLISLGLEVGRLIYGVNAAFGNRSTSLKAVNDELDGTVTVLEELHTLLTSPQPSSKFFQAVQNSRLPVIVQSTKEHLSSLKRGLGTFGLAGPEKPKKWQKWKLLLVEKHLQKNVESLQRQKLGLLLALSTFTLYTDIQLHQISESTSLDLANTVTVLKGLTGSAEITNSLLLQILRGQSLQEHANLSFHQLIIRQIDLQLKSAQRIGTNPPEYIPPFANDGEFTVPEGKIYLKRNFLGTLEVVFCSPTQLNFASAGRFFKGIGTRLSYVPPPWFFRMVISISLAVISFPRLELNFGIRYVAEIPWESDVLTFSHVGDMDGLVSLIRKGSAGATDRDGRGVTPLHLAAYRRDIPMCKFLLSQGADPMAVMRYSHVDEMNITPLRYLALSGHFRSLPTQSQQEMLFLLGTSSLPQISLPKKSISQIFLTPNEVSCDQGSITAADLKSLDIEARDDCEVTYLMMACEFGLVDAVRMLLEWGLDINAVNKWGHTALHYAYGAGSEDCIEELLVKGANEKIRGCKELGAMTPREMAISRSFGDAWEKSYKRARTRIRRRVRKMRQKRRRDGLEDEVFHGLDLLFDTDHLLGQLIDVNGDSRGNGDVTELDQAVGLRKYLTTLSFKYCIIFLLVVGALWIANINCNLHI